MKAYVIKIGKISQKKFKWATKTGPKRQYLHFFMDAIEKNAFYKKYAQRAI